MVNLRPETDPETEYVSFDRPRVLRVLDRIIADLDELAGFPAIIDEERGKVGDAEARRARHRRRPARARPATETVERAGRTSGATGLARSSAHREGLNEPGPSPLVRTFRPRQAGCAFCPGRRSHLSSILNILLRFYVPLLHIGRW